MNLRWLFGNYTDPQYELPRREQFRLSWVAHEKFLSGRAFWGWTALIVAPAIAAVAVLEPLLAWFGFGANSDAYTVGLAIIVMLFWPWCAWMYRYTYVKPIRRAMRDEGFDLCIECGYDLRGLRESSRCPECGSVRQALPDHPTKIERSGPAGVTEK